MKDGTDLQKELFKDKSEISISFNINCYDSKS